MKEVKQGSPFSPSSPGFTLLELTVATILISIMGSAVGALLIRGMTAWRISDAKLQQVFLMEKAVDTLGEELRNGVVLAEKPFEGLKEELSFAVDQDALHLAQVRYRLLPHEDSFSFVRESASFPQKEEPLQTKTLIPRVKSISFRYGVVKKTGEETRFLWSPAWGTPEEPLVDFPKMVEVKVESIDAAGRHRSFSRRIFVPRGVLGNSPA